MAASTTERPDRRHEIDVLRFGAALAVVFYNLVYFLPTNSIVRGVSFPGLEDVASYGYLGVELFFVISGYVIFMSAEGARPSAFAASRIGRLYPAYWAAVTISALAILLMNSDAKPLGIAQYLINLTMLHSFVGQEAVDPVYWTLVLELKFYMLVWIAMLLAPKRLEWALYVWIAICAASYVLPLFDNAIVRTVLISAYAPYFMMGALCRLASRSGWTALRATAAAIVFAMALKSAQHEFVRYAIDFDTRNNLFVVWGGVSLIFLIFIGISLNLTSSEFLKQISWIGALTYPLYLSHFTIGELIMSRGAGLLAPYGALALSLAAAFLLALALHAYIEKPYCRRLRQFAQNRLEWIAEMITSWRSSLAR